MTEKEKRPVGRPKKYSGKRPTWTFRLEENFGNEIKRIAQETGRSISEVCEQQIVASFRLATANKQLEARIATLNEEMSELRFSRTHIAQQVTSMGELVDRTKTELDVCRETSRQLELKLAGQAAQIDGLLREVHRNSLSDDPQIEEIVYSAVKRALGEKNGDGS